MATEVVTMGAQLSKFIRKLPLEVPKVSMTALQLRAHELFYEGALGIGIPRNSIKVLHIAGSVML